MIKEQFAKVTKRKSIDAENIDSDNRKKEANNLRHQSEKVRKLTFHKYDGEVFKSKAAMQKTNFLEFFF